ncbi:MAG: heparinase II/III family protein [Caldilineales bacterium]|nr:heparinase II/III family protein [Caldilineales bacterium]
MKSRFELVLSLWRHFGLRWLATRMAYQARLRGGWYRLRHPVRRWDQHPPASWLADHALATPAAYGRYRRRQAPPFFFGSSDRPRFAALFPAWDTDPVRSPLAEAEALRVGRLRLFGCLELETGCPPDWHRHPHTGLAFLRVHWSRIDEFGQGDVKLVWEPARFGFTFALVRAYWRTGDPSWAELFWQLVESWRETNPPQAGVHWHSGQEVALRVLAWCFGLYGFLDAPPTTDERLLMLAQMVAVSGRRLEATLTYGLSQQNNHSLSEAAGLWTIGLLFPELRWARRWVQRGQAILESQTRRLFYKDGAFAQHSCNYERLALHDLIWAVRLGDVCGRPLATDLREMLAQAALLLYAMQDEDTGRLPNYGQNDGALLLPLSNTDPRDFRPVVQTAHYLGLGTLCCPPGPWDEELLWLAGPEALQAFRQPFPRGDRLSASGYHVLRDRHSFVFLRCGAYRHRPGQADMLHLDLWWQGQNIALDPGTFGYHAGPPWDDIPLARTGFHNTVTVDGCDQMRRVGRFLWLPWLQGRFTHFRYRPTGAPAWWQGEHDGYRRLGVSYRRGVARLGGDVWVVLDALDDESGAVHVYRLHWLLADVPYEWDPAARRLLLHTPAGDYLVAWTQTETADEASLMRADPASPRGWQALCYGVRAPALSLAVVVRGARTRFVTLLAPPPATVSLRNGLIHVETDDAQAVLTTLSGACGALVSHIELFGSQAETLTVIPQV